MGRSNSRVTPPNESISENKVKIKLHFLNKLKRMPLASHILTSLHVSCDRANVNAYSQNTKIFSFSPSWKGIHFLNLEALKLNT